MLGQVNIDSRGYGKIYKAVMRNRELPLLAKTIYAYFCAYAGNGIKAFPKRDKIVKDLQINKDTYTKHLSWLIKDGYISKERLPGGNVYTVMQTIPAYNKTDQPEIIGDDELTDKLIFENVAARGYGTVPKLVMLDIRLSAQAKAIYAYFASFAGAGSTAFPRRSTVMRELGMRSTNTYYKHLEQLVERGYLSVEQHKSNGRFDVCTYRLSEIVSAETVSSPHRRRKKRSSEKMRHDENDGDIDNLNTVGNPESPMSEKVQPGGKLSDFPADMSEKVISYKQAYEKTVSHNSGHSNINNISTRNSYFMTEQVYNHQRRSRPTETERLTLFSSAEVKQRIGYDRLKSEADSWGVLLKGALGQLADSEDESRYYCTMNEILNEIVAQLVAILNKSKNAETLLTKVESDTLALMFDDILTRWDEIRNIRAYVAASLSNLLRL